MAYIERTVVLTTLHEMLTNIQNADGDEGVYQTVEAVRDVIALLPTVDVVRCKDCRHKDRMSSGNVILCTRKAKVIRMKPDDYCSYGESCEHDFEYDELHREFVCKKCFHVLTREEKRELLEHANALRKAEEKNEPES